MVMAMHISTLRGVVAHHGHTRPHSQGLSWEMYAHGTLPAHRLDAPAAAPAAAHRIAETAIYTRAFSSAQTSRSEIGTDVFVQSIILFDVGGSIRLGASG